MFGPINYHLAFYLLCFGPPMETLRNKRCQKGDQIFFSNCATHCYAINVFSVILNIVQNFWMVKIWQGSSMLLIFTQWFWWKFTFYHGWPWFSLPQLVRRQQLRPLCLAGDPKQHAWQLIPQGIGYSIYYVVYLSIYLSVCLSIYLSI